MVRHVHCENIEQWIWAQFLSWENERVAYQRLKKKYQQNQVPHPDRVAFQNTPVLIYHLKQARAIFQKQDQINLWLDPLFLYYGMMSLLKAVVITKDTKYPSHTAVLRHGLSTRKRKRQPYQWLHDQIKIQKEGLFPHAIQLLYQPLPTGSSYQPKTLLSMLPDLQDDLITLTGERTLYPIQILSTPEATDDLGMLFSIERQAIDHMHLSPIRFAERLTRGGGKATFTADSAVTEPEKYCFRWTHPDTHHVLHCAEGFDHPAIFANKKDAYFLWVNHNDHAEPLSTLWVYYLLFFSLSMLCRYDVPLWGELLDTSKEVILVEPLLLEARRHFPHLILNLLQEEKIVLWLH